MIDKLKKYEAIVASGEIGAGTRNEVAAMLGKAANEIAAKDAMIDKLKFDNLHLKSCQRQSGEVIIEQTNKVIAKDSEIANIRALVGEMLSHIEELYQCKSPCDSRCLHKKESYEFRARRELIAKAREVVK